MQTGFSLRPFVRHVPLVGSIVGMVLILGSSAVFLDSDVARIGGATSGILVLLGAVWYAANPFFKSTRRYLLLRAEIGRFIGLAREVNATVVNGGSPGEIERARSQLHDSVERIVAAAGKVQPSGTYPHTKEFSAPSRNH